MKHLITIFLLFTASMTLLQANPVLPARTITIKNDTGYEINEVSARQRGTVDWSETLMKTEALADGDQIKITIPDAGPDNCNFDLFATSFDEIGLEWIIEDADVCKTRVFTFDESNFSDAAPEQDTTSGNSIQVTNGVGETIFYLYVRPSGSGQWSGDLLAGAGQDLYTFQDGETGDLAIPGLGDGTCRFDFKATALDESNVLSIVSNVDLCNNPSVTFRKGNAQNTNNAAQNVTGTITVSNKLGETVFYLYTRKSGSNDWGNDLLKTAGQELYTFQDGESGQLRIPGLSRNNCKFDIKATALDQTKVLVDARNVDLCTMNNIDLVLKDNSENNDNQDSNSGNAINVSNQIGETIFYLFVRKSGSSDWGEDLLAGAGETLYTFQNGETGSLNIPGFSRSTCKFDFKATALEKTKVLKTLTNVDLCRNSSVTFRK